MRTRWPILLTDREPRRLFAAERDYLEQLAVYEERAANPCKEGIA